MGFPLRITLEEGARAPAYANDGDAGLDLFSYEDLSLLPGEQRSVRTGVRMEIPSGYWGNIRDKSGLAMKVRVHRTAGVVDSTYRGEVVVLLENRGTEEHLITRGDKIAQMIIQRHETVDVLVVDELSDTKRGEGGFGSTGRR